jgi:fructose-bisphosphate aldolase class II
MELVTLTEMLNQAEQGHYAVGAFNANNLEIVQAIIGAAAKRKSPVIIQASQGALRYAGLEQITAMVKAGAQRAQLPVCLHLDHGTDFDQVMCCIRSGFSSVMIDASAYPLGENIQRTKEVVAVAKAVGVSVEAELGRIGGTEDEVSVSEREAFFTDPEEAGQFVRETGIDALAVAIGTAHGPYKGEPKLDLNRLEAIKAVVDIPIVLHGASGVPATAIKAAVERGVRKINIDTELRQAFTNKMRQVLLAKPDEYDPRKILGPAREVLQKAVQEKMELFGSVGKASQ